MAESCMGSVGSFVGAGELPCAFLQLALSMVRLAC
jgi:hypothetical protein